MKRIAVILVLLVVALAGCGGGGGSSFDLSGSWRITEQYTGAQGWNCLPGGDHISVWTVQQSGSSITATRPSGTQYTGSCNPETGSASWERTTSRGDLNTFILTTQGDDLLSGTETDVMADNRCRWNWTVTAERI